MWEEINFPDTLIENSVGRKNQINASEILPSGKFPVIDQGLGFIAGYCDDETKLVKDELPLIIFGDHTRYFKYVDFPFILGADGTKVLKPNSELFDSRFYYFALLSLDIPNRGYNRHFTLLREKKVPKPNIYEQRRIAYVLATAQIAIEEQIQLIAITHELKRAVMRKLFTEGFRGEKQKSTEIGLMPESWELKELGDISEIIMGQSPPGESYNADGIGDPLINGPVEFGPDPLSLTLETKFTTNPTKLCKKGDLILCVRGSTTGRTNIAKNRACIGRGVAAIRGKGNQDYLNQFITSVREQIYEMGTGSTFPNISTSQIKEILIPYPPISEQTEIVEIMTILDKKMDLTKKKQVTLSLLFRTLLHQLMTGKKRVNEIDLPGLL